MLFIPYPKNPGLLVPDENDTERLTYFLYTDFDFKTKVQFLVDEQGDIHFIWERHIFHKIS